VKNNLTQTNISFNHLAVVVEDLESALKFWRDGLGLPVGTVQRSDVEEVDIAFLPLDGGEIELLAPINTTSGIAKYLVKRGAGMHHICLEVPDLNAAMDRLRQHGIELINETLRIGADGKAYCFIHPKSANGVLVELYQIVADADNTLDHGTA
jgi:methylmalonyl-CoA/ethylmalonyl-CoA epimerase